MPDRHRFPWIIVGPLLVAGLAACIPRADSVVDDLVQTAPGEFRYTATASMLHPANSPQEEHYRQRRLGDLMAAQKMCPQGFVVLSRTPPMGPAGAGSEQYMRALVYDGRCK